jgi:hypothetical protein
VRVPIWHLVWLGVWTGYTMALAGQAAGIFALPYTMSVLQFTNPHVAPTIQLLTLLNPFGALLGFRETGQWNLDFALPVCLGGILGGNPRPIRARAIPDGRKAVSVYRRDYARDRRCSPAVFCL